MSERDEFGAFLIGFVVGGVTGAIAALLLAPQSGEETREMIKEHAIDLRGKAEETATGAYKQAEIAANQAVHRAEELLAKAKQTADELQKKGVELIEGQKAKLGHVVSKGEVTISDEGDSK